jgi:hypothetical protein
VVTPPPVSPAFEDVADNPARASHPASKTVPDDVDEGGMSRTTLRLPDHVKVRMEEAAAREGLSVNAWLVRTVGAALEPKNRSPSTRAATGGERYTGWVR